MRNRLPVFLTILFIFFLPFLHAENKEPVRAELIVEQETVQPGKPFTVGIHLTLEDKWHAYWKNPGDAGMPPTVEWDLPEGFAVDEIQWPTPKKINSNDSISYGYEDDVVLLSKITPPVDAEGEAALSANLRWVVCNDSSCLPGRATVSSTITVSSGNPKTNVEHQEIFNRARKSLPMVSNKGKASRAEGLITLDLEAPGEVIEAQFFPEDPDSIDITAAAVVNKGREGTGRWDIVLKESEEGDETAFIRGVLVLSTPRDRTSYAIDFPVQNVSGNEIAMTDSSFTNSERPTTEQASQQEYLFVLGLAFVGGLILNLMPCVLPVISFKVLHFVKMAGQDRLLTFKHGLAFVGGVMISFWALAGALLCLQAYGHAVGWGFQLQSPLFVAVLAAVILIFGLSMFGVLEFGTGVASMAGQAETSNASSGLANSFFSGILATAVATPCTGPFLGTAVGFAVTLPPLPAMLIFSSLGLGMSSPYLLLGAFPGLLNYMPKPGNWMVAFKEAMGFVMMATVLWLLWVFGAQTGTLAMTILLAAFLLISIGCWIFGRWSSPIRKKSIRLFSTIVSALVFCAGSYSLYLASTLPQDHAISSEHSHGKWEDFSPERVAMLQAKGIPVFVDFTAKWCLICQANHLVLSSEEVEKKFDELGVVRMKADWTKSDPVITKELEKYGRNSVPLYLLFNVDKEAPAKILPQVLTPQIVLEQLDELVSN